MVIDRGAFLSGELARSPTRSPRVKEACGEAHLKVILETGELLTYDNVRRASQLAIAAGADFIKTSTGKIQPAATPPVVLVMLEAIRDHYVATGRQIGMKPAGGIRTTKQAVQHLMLKETLGDAWLTPDLFRFGASTLQRPAHAAGQGVDRALPERGLLHDRLAATGSRGPRTPGATVFAALFPYSDCAASTVRCARSGIVVPGKSNEPCRMIVSALTLPSALADVPERARPDLAVVVDLAVQVARVVQVRVDAAEAVRNGRSCTRSSPSPRRTAAAPARARRLLRDDVGDRHRPVVAEALADRAGLSEANEKFCESWIAWPYSWRITSASSASSTPPLPKRSSSLGWSVSNELSAPDWLIRTACGRLSIARRVTPKPRLWMYFCASVTQ